MGLALLPDGGAAVSWVARNDHGSNTLHVAVVDADNEVLATQTVADIAQLRVFPQLGFQDNHLVLAWTDDVEEGRMLHAAQYPLALP